MTAAIYGFPPNPRQLYLHRVMLCSRHNSTSMGNGLNIRGTSHVDCIWFVSLFLVWFLSDRHAHAWSFHILCNFVSQTALVYIYILSYKKYVFCEFCVGFFKLSLDSCGYIPVYLLALGQTYYCIEAPYSLILFKAALPDMGQWQWSNIPENGQNLPSP